MAVVVHPVSTAGAITAPTSTLKVLLGSAHGERFHGGLPVNTARLPHRSGILMADGISPIYSAYDDDMIRVSLLAPENAPTATPTGTQATATLDLDVSSDGVYTPADGETIYCGYSFVKFVTTLSTTSDAFHDEIKIGGSASAALDNLKAWVEQSGTGGVEYLNNSHPSASDPSSIIEVTSKTATTLALRAKEYGTSGNAIWAGLRTGTWTDSSFGSAGTTVSTTISYFTGGADGSGSAPSAGDYRYFYTYYRSADGAESGPSPFVTASQGTAQNIDLASLADPSPADASIDFIRIYRTEDTGDEFFRLAEIATGGAGTYTDSTPDGEEDGSLQGYGNVPYDELAHKKYRGGMAPRGLCVTEWGKRAWTAGAIILEDYSVGTASVTNDSDTVTLSAAAVPTDDMRFNTFQVSGDAETYTIMAVAEATRVLTLDRSYQGTTAGTANYTVSDDRDAHTLNGSEELLYNQWPVTNQPGGTDSSDDDEGVVALWGKMKSALLGWSKTQMVRLTGDSPVSWDVHQVAETGAVSQRSIVEHKGALYWISPDANVYVWAGGEPVSISSPDFNAADTTPFGIDRTMNRINWKHAHLIDGYYCQRTKTIRWSVPLDDSVHPNYDIVFDVAGKRWGLDTGHTASMAGTSDVSGGRLCLLGDFAGNLWHADHMDATNCDGAFGFEPVQSIASGATVRSISAKTGTPFPTSGEGLAGVPATVVYAAGALEHTRIASNTSSVLTLEQDVTAPAEDDQVIVGCIPAWWKTGRPQFGNFWDQATVGNIQVHYQKDSDGEYFYAYADDEDTALRTPDTDQDTTKGAFTGDDRADRFDFAETTYGGQIQLTVLEPGLTTAAFVAIAADVDGRH